MSLKKIAEELGLSLTTVSRALNGYPEVAEATRVLVREAAARHGYHPDARARGLALGRADAVGIVFPMTPGDLGDLLFLEVAHSMSQRLADAGLSLLIISASANDELAIYRRTIAARRVDAFVVPRTRLDDERLALLHASQVPFVAYGRSKNFTAPYAWLDFDNGAGTRMAAQRLIGLGHRAFGYIGASPSYNFAAQRYDGFVKALRAAKLTPAPQAVQRVALDRRSGYAAMQALLALPEPPTAVLVDNHLAGAGAVHAALQAGCVLGRDLSLIVYDGVGPDSVLRSPVTSIEQPTTAQVGEALAEMVLARLKGVAPEALHRLRMPELRPGDSDGPPPGARRSRR
ncbi:MAG TPA: substrate-binding domain-containing protein [Burkholderiaceae bacterium]|nr:substrate-binding domain-containing protein [Burkholderiaceae bacterium]